MLFFILVIYRLLYPGMRYIDLCNIEVLCKTSNASPDPGGEISTHTEDSSTPGEDSDMESHLPAPTESQDSEPYTTENLSSIRGGYKLLSDVVAIMHFNFNDPEVSIGNTILMLILSLYEIDNVQSMKIPDRYKVVLKTVQVK